jgi:hypothetical protein
MLHAKCLAASCLVGFTACTPIPFALAPGAAQVRVTNVAADVAGCAPVGNIQVPRDAGHALGQLKNQTIGFGGNAALVTDGTLDFPNVGIAYHCPELAGAGT